MVESGRQGVLIVGCGRSGLAAARLHVRRGDPRPLWVYDDNEQAQERAAKDGFSVWHGDASDVAFAVWSPGIPLASPLADRLRAAGVRIVSELSFAAPDLPPTIVVTGTNGKSTVCELITAMLKAAGRAVGCAGNVGVPASDMALNGEHFEWLVVECSSYQLELELKLDVRVAVLTNLAPDHLDRYPALNDYYLAKWSIFEQMPKEAGAVLPYDLGAVERIEGRGRIGGRALPDPMTEVMGWQRTAALAGEVGLENLAQAVAAARCAGADDASMQQATAVFAGLPHRAQKVCEGQGLTYVNDSKATNVAAAIASLERVDGDVVVLLGGAGKGEDYSLLAQCIEQRGVQAICFGDEGDRLAAATGAPRVDDLTTALNQATHQLPSGGTILLAPACASFDAYSSFVARGDHFASLARGQVNS